MRACAGPDRRLPGLILFAWGVAGMSGLADGQPLSFGPEEVGGLVRARTVKAPRCTGTVYVYGTFETGASNPVPYADGRPRELQLLTLGESRGGDFRPALQFGMSDGRNLPTEHGYVTPWVRAGDLDHYGGFARPDTPYDFRLRIDLTRSLATVWCAGRGDDAWSLLAEDVPLLDPVTALDEVRIEQHPGARGIHDFVLQAEAWPPGESPRPQPRAEEGRLVRERAGFRFQAPRSVWRLPGRHVTIARRPPVWMGFPDVVQVDARTLVCTHNDGVGHGGGGKLLVRRSEDLGRTWSDAVVVHPSGINCPRLQRLRNGTLLLLADVGGRDPVLYDSLDGGRTWVNGRTLDPLQCGGNQACVPSRVTELPDGSWLLTGSWYPGGKAYEGTEGERLELFRSTDRGRTWQLHSYLQAYPPHSLSEASVLVLPGNRLMLYAREARSDGFPGVKAYSADNGKTWGPVQELPFAITGRTCAGFLRDGRVMLTFRSGIGRSALWAWIGRADDETPYHRIAGAHLNDSRSVGLKRGALYLDNDAACGQFTRYFLRPPDSPESTTDVTVEVEVLANRGHAVTLSIPFVGKLRLFPDHLELASGADLRAPVTPGRFHVYRVLRQSGSATVFIDGRAALTTDKLDDRTVRCGWTPAVVSIYPFAFGNETGGTGSATNTYPREITPKVTGCSLWRRVEATVDDPRTGRHELSWSARDGFPDQYQLDHIVEVDATADGHDQGYSGWCELEDGRIFVVNYTDDTAPTCPPTGLLHMGVSWIRGTYLLPSDLPPLSRKAP